METGGGILSGELGIGASYIHDCRCLIIFPWCSGTWSFERSLSLVEAFMLELDVLSFFYRDIPGEELYSGIG